MHTESCPSAKLSGELDGCSTPNDTSVLEEDLALSSSTLGPHDRSGQEQTEAKSRFYRSSGNLVYLNEETMDCAYSESADTPKGRDSRNEASSPEMFGSEDEEDEEKSGGKHFGESSPKRRDSSSFKDSTFIGESTEATEEELIEKSDCYLLARMHKFLSGVPPPPKLTICQSDCGDLLARLRANRRYFVLDPFSPIEDKETKISEEITTIGEKNTKIVEKTVEKVGEEVKTTENIARNSPIERSLRDRRGKSSLRNLTNAFDACERDNDTTSVDDETTKEQFPDDSKDSRTSSEFTSKNDTSDRITKNYDNDRSMTMRSDESLTCNVKTSRLTGNKETIKRVTFEVPEDEPMHFSSTIGVDDVKTMPWDLAYRHKSHGIHYNRSKIVEEFEELTMKLCQRYIGAETQSSCNVWFTKQTPGSMKKRNLLSRRNNGQSPGKRLSHLARRRRTFSSANLQILGMGDKKQLVLNIKKPTIRKGKSPRGKSPRGSAKKRAGLSRISPSPRKAKLETSKRALFQSPPHDRAGPSNRGTSLVSQNSQQRIKRALFPASKSKSEIATSTNGASDIKRALTFDESKKRKSEDELEGPRFKWAKSLSFDCTHVSENNSADSWTTERHSTGNFHMRSETSLQPEKSELSEAHRKKLLWAVAEALRGKGISMGHPRFKQCASQLARIVKKYMPDLENPNVPRKPGSTSDRMLRLAKRHVLLIVESKSTE